MNPGLLKPEMRIYRVQEVRPLYRRRGYCGRQCGLLQTESAPQHGPSWPQRVCIRAAGLWPLTMIPAPALIRRRPLVPQSGQSPEGLALIPSNFSKCRPQPGHSYS